MTTKPTVRPLVTPKLTPPGGIKLAAPKLTLSSVMQTAKKPVPARALPSPKPPQKPKK